MKEKEEKDYKRFNAFPIIMVIVFCAVFSRLTFLQIVKGEEYKEKANNSSVREIPDEAPRGEILDKNGVVLASNQQSFVLVYNQTEESNLYFYQTMDKVFKILKDNNEKSVDEFELKTNPFRFEFKFKGQDEETLKALEIRFKRDCAMNDKIEKELFKDNKEKLTKDQTEKVNEKLLQYTPEQTYNYLVDFYNITPEGNFKNMLELYKIEPDAALEQLTTVFGIKVDDELKNFLEQYKKQSKKDAKDKLLKVLIDKYNISSKKFDLEQQRKYMIIKDTIRRQSFSGYKPITIASNISQSTAFIFLQNLNDLPGIDVNTQPIRTYPFNELGSSFLGYISKISSNQDRYKEKGYDISSDYIGVTGLEASLESRLKGTKGGRIVKLNKHGRVIEELGRREPYPGQNVKLTIDKNVQLAMEKSLDLAMSNLQKGVDAYDKVNTINASRGAAVAIDVRNGGIIGLASRPGYDPNMFATPGRLTDELYKKYLEPNLEAYGQEYIKRSGLQITVDDLFPIDEKLSKKNNKTVRKDPHDVIPKPLYNYATSSLVPPGSTFKPMTAVAGLEEGVITPDERIYDGLIYKKNNYNGKDWNTTSEGNINVARALEVSNNYFFYEVGDRLFLKGGLDALAKYAWRFGLGVNPKGNEKASSGIEIAENYGQVFNIESSKENNSSYLMLSLYEDLKKIRKNKDTNEPEGINIEANDSDSNDVKELKEKIRSNIKQQMKYRNVNDFSNSVKAMLKNLTELVPEAKTKNFTSSDFNVAMQKINFAVDEVSRNVIRPGNIYNASIGQGENRFTPLQMANYIATIVNGGTRYKLHLVDEYLDSDNKVINKVQPEVYEKIDLKPSTVQIVRDGMLKVNSGENGTAGDVFKEFEKYGLITAGKTGSATVGDDQDKWGRTSYGVYVGFAPYENPEIAVCVIIFDGGHGGYVAPVAKATYEAYFKEQLKAKNYVPSPLYDGVENFMKDIYEGKN